MTSRKVLFLCTGNSCRSQMAEGWLRHYARERAEVFSAGTNPAGLNPMAVTVMRESGIDISDQRSKHVDELAKEEFLFVITVCDIRAVGPGVWNNWKGELLRTLYWETEVVLSGGHSAIDRKERVAQAREQLRLALPEWSGLDFEAYAARLPQAYWLKASLEEKLLHAKLLNRTEIEVSAPITHIRTDRDRGVTELTIIAPDHARLLSIVAGACAATGANIVDAQVFTTADGMALDTIFVSRVFGYDEDELRRADSIVRSHLFHGKAWVKRPRVPNCTIRAKPELVRLEGC